MDENAANEGRAQEQQEVRDSVGETSSEETSQPTLSYDTYKRTVGEAKKFKSQLSEAQEKLKLYEQKEMEKEEVEAKKEQQKGKQQRLYNKQ